MSNKLAHWALNAVLVTLMALAAVVVVLPRVTHAVPLTVLTGSMTPTIRPGDLVIVRPTPAEALYLGDIVTFQPVSGVATLITHRVIQIDRDAAGQVTGIQTQGDANNSPDKPLVPGQVMGRVWYTVPKIGRLTNGQNTLFVLGAMGAAMVAYAIMLVLKKDPEPTLAVAPAIAVEPTLPIELPPMGRHLKAVIELEAAPTGRHLRKG